jgi:hypothetical protein
MPLKKKNTARNKIIVWIILAVLIILATISFPPAQNLTEIVLFS